MNKRGITLVALVITIIVLLILAGVSISMLTGENGILTKALSAKDKYEEASAYEEQLINSVGEMIDSPIYIAEGKKWNIDFENQTVTRDDKTLQIGDYVLYDPFSGTADMNAKISYDSENTGTDSYGVQSVSLADYEPVYYYLNSGSWRTTTDLTMTDKQYIISNSWKVFGVDEYGQLLLISSECLVTRQDDTLSNRMDHFLNFQFMNKKGYDNINDKLNNICSIFGYGNCASRARCVSINDVNRLTGYNPNCVGVKNPTQAQIDSGTKFAEGTIREYGNEITYYWDGTNYPYYTTSNGLSGNITYPHYNFFKWYSGDDYNVSDKPTEGIDTSNKHEITTLTNTGYYYYVNTLTETEDTSASVGVATGSNIYNVLDYPLLGYWLTSDERAFTAFTSEQEYCVFQYLDDNEVDAYPIVTTAGMGKAHGPVGIRAVIEVSPDAILTDTGMNMYDADACWNITMPQ